MNAEACGYHSAVIENLDPESTYLYEAEDGRMLPDPSSRFQPQGVHGPSQLLDPGAYSWGDSLWRGRELSTSIFYELHVGTYTEAGTFDAIIPHLDELRELGITTIELMPIAQFPGGRNWGYDGVHPFAAQNTYGGPRGLQRLVDAAHRRGLAVALDVVYNHLGPEGNYLGVFGPYFSNRYKTPWGEAINFDGAESGPVRRFFIENALYWLRDFHFDVLRLDAIHGIFDFSANHILSELREEVRALSARIGRQVQVIAESDLNDARVLHSKEQGGYELDAQWSDDYQHSLHVLLTRERGGYYEDFGTLKQLAETLTNGWYFSGQYSRYRRRKFGNSPAGIAKNRFVVYTQNHDQVGNRAQGDRLSTLVNFEALKLAAGITLLSPFIPLLFMGEEYGEAAPFNYFVSHGDQALAEAVRRGRLEDFASFDWRGEIPDPQAESTFESSRLCHLNKDREPHRTLLRIYKELICLRNERRPGGSDGWELRQHGENVLVINKSSGDQLLSSIFNFSDAVNSIDLSLPPIEWKLRLDSADVSWLGPGGVFPPTLNTAGTITGALQPWSFVVLQGVLMGSI